MAAITKTIASSSTDSQLRPFDARRDLGAVADLVELCFADTLDSEGTGLCGAHALRCPQGRPF